MHSWRPRAASIELLQYGAGAQAVQQRREDDDQAHDGENVALAGKRGAFGREREVINRTETAHPEEGNGDALVARAFMPEETQPAGQRANDENESSRDAEVRPVDDAQDGWQFGTEHDQNDGEQRLFQTAGKVVERRVEVVSDLDPAQRDSGGEGGEEAIALDQFGQTIGKEDAGQRHEATLRTGERAVFRVPVQELADPPTDRSACRQTDDDTIEHVAQGKSGRQLP